MSDLCDDRGDEIWCDRCQGLGTTACHCGGDQCYCDNQGEMDCPRCNGEGWFVPQPGQLEREAESARQMRKVLAAALTPKEPR